MSCQDGDVVKIGEQWWRCDHGTLIPHDIIGPVIPGVGTSAYRRIDVGNLDQRLQEQLSLLTTDDDEIDYLRPESDDEQGPGRQIPLGG